MKLNTVLLAGLVSIGLLTLAQIALSQAVEEAVIFRPGTPVELQLRQGLAWHKRLLTKPGRQTTGWAHYSAQLGQVQPNVTTGTSGSALQHNAVTP